MENSQIVLMNSLEKKRVKIFELKLLRKFEMSVCFTEIIEAGLL